MQALSEVGEIRNSPSPSVEIPQGSAALQLIRVVFQDYCSQSGLCKNVAFLQGKCLQFFELCPWTPLGAQPPDLQISTPIPLYRPKPRVSFFHSFAEKCWYFTLSIRIRTN